MDLTYYAKSEYNHCVYRIFIMLVTYVILVESTSMVEITKHGLYQQVVSIGEDV
jgi:hypothetical protein